MVRLLTPTIIVGLAWAGVTTAADHSEDRHHFSMQLALSYTSASTPLVSWTEGGVGKLRYDENNDGFTGARAFVEYRGQITPTLSVTAIADFVDDASAGLDLTEAYLSWLPVPKGPNRTQWKFGAFYPPLSLENTGTGWSSPYTRSYSAINTWIGEEVRVFGAEWSVRRRLGGPASPHRLRFLAAGFYGNDPAGTLVTFKGWSLHDRQTRLDDELPLPNGNSLRPFLEIDQRPGYYAGLEWRYAKLLLIRAIHYDNRADPNEFSGGEWGWDTHFNHIGTQIQGPWELGLVAQWLQGNTVWILGATPGGQIVGSGPLISTDFESSFVLLTRQFKNHRASLRYDDFEVSDGTGQVDNGHGWTLAYQYKATPRITVGAEWLSVNTWHPRWSFLGLNPSATERQLQLGVSIRLGD